MTNPSVRRARGSRLSRSAPIFGRCEWAGEYGRHGAGLEGRWTQIGLAQASSPSSWITLT
jgi:hypothetical protein